jgi:stage II sporulation protein D
MNFLIAGILIGLIFAGCTKPPTIRPTPETPQMKRGITWVRIRLLNGIHEVSFSSQEPYIIKVGRKSLHSNPDKVWTVSLRSNRLVVRSNEGTGIRKPQLPLTVIPRRSDGIITLNGKPYRGRLEISQKRDGTLMAVNVIDIEEYLRGVVPLEIGHLDPSKIEAVKAQAVAARSYALAQLNEHSSNGYDLEPTVRHQVYGGQLAETPLSDLAVLETYGIVASFKGKPIDARYSSTCGGRTTSPEFVWSGGGLPYLVGRFDGRSRHSKRLHEAFCQKSPRFEWKRIWKKSAFFQKIKNNLPSIVGKADIGEIEKVNTKRRDPSGRVLTLEVKTTKGDFDVEKGAVRKLLKYPNGNILRSNFFDLSIDENTVTMNGRGMGHGVGMCQWGAIGMAEQGYSFRQILNHYYTRITLKKLRRIRRVVNDKIGRG